MLSRCGCVRLIPLLRLLKCLIDSHQTPAGPRGDNVDPMREYGVIESKMSSLKYIKIQPFHLLITLKPKNSNNSSIVCIDRICLK